MNSDIYHKRLHGTDLIAQVKMSAKLRKAALVIRCGYTKIVGTQGRILPDYDAFYTSLNEARREHEQFVSFVQQNSNDHKIFLNYERRLRDAYAKSKNQSA
jgi:hypothetical protein